MSDEETIQALKERNYALTHAIQTGVGAKMLISGSETSPKQLRTGVNNALVQLGVIAKVLIDKGLLSELEYWQLMNEGLEVEVKGYEEYLSEQHKAKITLI